jgi:DNA polymerase III subunit delta
VTAASTTVVVGTDATMVYDALHHVVAAALGDLDPSVALQDFTVKDVTTTGESVVPSVLEALNTPAFLVDRRVVVVRDAQGLVAEEVAALVEWMQRPAPDVALVLAVVGAKSHKIVKAAREVVDVNVGSRVKERQAFVGDKLAQYRVTADAPAVAAIAARVGDDVARVDSLARLLASVYGSAPLNSSHVEPYLGDAGAVPEWDLTDALERGDATTAITVARRMLDSRGRAGVQIIFLLQRYYLRMARLEGAHVSSPDDAAQLLGMNPFGARKLLSMANRMGAERIADAVHLIATADVDLKGGVSYGGRDLHTDSDPTDLTVIEVLVARLARLSASARRA